MSYNKQTRFSLRKGLSSDLPTHAPLGEPLFCTDTKELYIGMGEGIKPQPVTNKKITEKLDSIENEKLKNFWVNVWEYYYLVDNKGTENESWSKAIQKAIDDVTLNTTVYKGIYFPPYKYQITTTVFIPQNINIRGEVQSLVNQGGGYINTDYRATVFQPITDDGTPVIQVGSKTYEKQSDRFFGCSIENIVIHGNDLDRSGLLVQGLGSEGYFKNIYIQHLKREGLKLVDAYDSTYLSICILYCGTNNEYAGLNLGSRFDNSNANKFLGLHIENCPYMFHIDNARHNQFIACKFESHTGSPRNYRHSVCTFGANVKEITFNSCFFVQDNVSEYGFLPEEVPYMIKGLGTQNPKYSSIKFIGCNFSSPNYDLEGTKWIDLSLMKKVTISNCDFHKVYSGDYGIKLGELSNFNNNYVAFLGTNTNCNLLSITNKTNVNNNTFENEGTTVNDGYAINLLGTNNIVTYNKFIGKFSKYYKLNHKSNQVVRNIDWVNAINCVSQLDLASYNSNLFSIKTSGTITDILNGFIGEEVSIYANTTGIVLEHNSSKLNLSPAENYTMNPGDVITFKQYDGFWREISRSSKYVGRGLTTNRPTNVKIGQQFFDINLLKPIWVKQITPSIVWIDANGVEV